MSTPLPEPADRNEIRCYCPKCKTEVSLPGAYSAMPRRRSLKDASLSDLEALRYDCFACPHCEELFELVFQVIAYLEPAECQEEVLSARIAKQVEHA